MDGETHPAGRLAEPSRAPGHPASEHQRVLPAAHLQPRRIVVACPDPCLSEMVESILRHHEEQLAPMGLEVRRVADGLTCLQDVELTRPDLLVLHSRLERLAPAEILQAWDSAHPGDPLPVLILSPSYGKDVPRGMAGAVVVTLPFVNAELVALVERALGTSGGP